MKVSQWPCLTTGTDSSPDIKSTYTAPIDSNEGNSDCESHHLKIILHLSWSIHNDDGRRMG
jgi:hypothetical protein